MDRIIIFDGLCNLCNGAVNFIIARDAAARFTFCPLQSDYAQHLIREHCSEHTGADTFLLIKNNRCYIRSRAALEIASELDGCWRLLRFARIIPRPVRDGLYRIIARHRYRIFGKRGSCMVPNEELKKRFVDENRDSGHCQKTG